MNLIVVNSPVVRWAVYLLAGTAAAQTPSPPSPSEASAPQGWSRDMFRKDDPLATPSYWLLVQARASSVLYRLPPAEKARVVGTWESQARDGSARAAVLAGDALWMEETLNACARAETLFLRSVELGAREAPYLLSLYFANAPCMKHRRKEAKSWHDRALQLGDTRAVGFSQGRGRNVWSSPAETLAEENRVRAEVAARAPTSGPILEQPVAVTMPPDAAPGWSYQVDRLDHTRQCALNVVQNCRGIPFAVRYSLTNTLDVYLVCRLKVEYASLGASEKKSYQRLAVVAPAAKRIVLAGEVDTDIPEGGASADCTPLTPNPIASAPEASCSAKLINGIRLDEYYPPAARRSGMQGTVAVRVFVRQSGEQPADVELMESSSFAVLDDAALKATRAQRFSANCDNAFGVFRIGFKLTQ